MAMTVCTHANPVIHIVKRDGIRPLGRRHAGAAGRAWYWRCWCALL